MAETLKEIFAKTNKGNALKQEFISNATYDMKMSSLMTTIDTKNDSNDLIVDDYMSDEDIDNFVINEDEVNNYWRYDLGGNKADADRVIYDELDISLHWEDSGAIPFAWADAYDNECHVINKLIIGDEETTHGEVLKKLIINDVNAKISKFGENADIKGKFTNIFDRETYYFMQCPKDEYMDEETGAIECNFEYNSYLIDNEEIIYQPSNDEWEEYTGMLEDCGRVWIYDNVIAFWSTLTPMLMKYLIDDLQTELNIDLMDFYYVYYDDNENVQCCTIREFIGQNNDDYTYKADDRAEVGNHLLPSDKKKETEQHKNFLNTRNEKDGKKLGNMTMAQYHNLIHQESKNSKKKLIKEGYTEDMYECFTYEELDKMFLTENEIHDNEDELINLITSANINDYDFKEELIDSIGQYQMIVLINGIEIPESLINFRIKPRQIGNEVLYQVHMFIDDKLQHKNIGTNLAYRIIQLYGNVYSGFGRILNKNAVFGMFKHLTKYNDVKVSYVTNKENQKIGIVAKLIQ